MNKEENLPAEVEYWLSPDTKHDCYFIVGSKSGPIERIGAFKAFLMGYSEPLRAMLQESALAEQGEISIFDITPETFRDFLKCLYMGLTDSIISNLSFQNCCEVLYVSDKYIVTKLKNKLVEQCLNTLTSEISCINVASSSKAFMQETRLEMALSKIVKDQIKNIISSEQFLQITHDSLLFILEQNLLNIDEVSLWQAVLKWAKNKTNSNDGNVIRKCTLKLLKHIRFCGMNVQDFCKEVVPTNVLTTKEVNQICKSYGTNEVQSMKYICNVATSRNNIDNLLEPKEVSFSYHVVDVCPHTFHGRKSRTFEFLNFNWHLRIARIDNTLGLYLECEGPRINDPNWKCRVKATLTLLNHHHSGLNYCLTLPYNTYCKGNSSKGYNQFILWSEVLRPTKPLRSFVHHNSITILVTVYA